MLGNLEKKPGNYIEGTKIWWYCQIMVAVDERGLDSIHQPATRELKKIAKVDSLENQIRTSCIIGKRKIMTFVFHSRGD